MPSPDLSTGVELNVADFKEMIHQVSFAASSDEARPVLQGVLMEINETRFPWLRLMDSGFLFGLRKLSSSQSNPVKVIIPARSLSELARIATDGNETVQ